MRRSLVILTAVLALIVATAAVAVAGSSRSVEKQDIIQIFEADGAASTQPYEVVGSAKLVRRDNRLKGTAKIEGLEPGGVYTFWWLVGEPNFAFPDDIPTTFVSLGGAKVVGNNGKATFRTSTDLGDHGIEGFLKHLTGTDVNPTDPFRPTLDAATSGIHFEIAYHGRAEDAGGDLDEWKSDFWTGTACPAVGDQAATQPHCPVSYVAIFPGG